ncbi:hypothetical protein E6Q11_04695 [Candidatus Dojkabacteria bacterium]|uniref:Uncharacterized protein n=1 Tax=Candidatus Dojkabacteria bacterium TaxID=2099670 RepID=A0A5C7J4L5_9BACT|nr:MAG: hypothetical protein E6Q11_04695 [Candidatus Dojkabacteria bacterium]
MNVKMALILLIVLLISLTRAYSDTDWPDESDKGYMSWQDKTIDYPDMYLTTVPSIEDCVSTLHLRDHYVAVYSNRTKECHIKHHPTRPADRYVYGTGSFMVTIHRYVNIPEYTVSTLDSYEESQPHVDNGDADMVICDRLVAGSCQLKVFPSSVGDTLIIKTL